MEDKELLRLAARAADLCVLPMYGSNDGKLYDSDLKEWNPLTDDGDALRLAVRLKIEFYEGTGDEQEAWAGYWKKGAERQLFASEPMGSDPYAATRRAIVRAAAEIGKAMP